MACGQECSQNEKGRRLLQIWVTVLSSTSRCHVFHVLNCFLFCWRSQRTWRISPSHWWVLREERDWETCSMPVYKSTRMMTLSTLQVTVFPLSFHTHTSDFTILKLIWKMFSFYYIQPTCMWINHYLVAMKDNIILWPACFTAHPLLSLSRSPSLSTSLSLFLSLIPSFCPSLLSSPPSPLRACGCPAKGRGYGQLHSSEGGECGLCCHGNVPCGVRWHVTRGLHHVE